MQILLLSTFPITDAAHGGQHRVKNIITALESQGHSVQSCGILGSAGYADTPGFLAYPGALPLRGYIDNPFLMEDWALGQLCVYDDEYFHALSTKIDPVPQIISCEHPWLVQFALRYIDQFSGSTKPKLIYGAHNVECELKRDIILQYFDRSTADKAYDIIFECESIALRSADLVTCVSEQDATWVKIQGARTVVIAPNGVADRRASLEDIKEANLITGARRFALYCASGHPPNIEGFYSVFGHGVGCFSPDARLVVAGAAGAAIQTHAQFPKTSGLKAAFVDAGVVSEAQLRGLLEAAHTLILPITRGGGTNLKTAEAIWSGNHVVATNKALRGFEEFASDMGIWRTSSPTDFCRAVEISLASPRNAISLDDRKKRSNLLWNNCLKPLTDAISRLEQHP